MDTGHLVDRRRLLTAGGAIAVSALFAEVIAEEAMKEIAKLRPGEYTWHPERQPEGAVAVVVSLPQQRVHVYRNGVRIAVSTCSTGKPGHSTPTGVFVVLQKDKHHHSSTYNNAPMPNMNRLTWSGVALHAGNLPGYPASHGCVRLPLEFSEKLFTITHLGTPVIIAGAHSDPWELTHPGMVLSAYAEHEFEQIENSLDGKKHPVDWTATQAMPIVSVIASSADRKIILVENGGVVAESALTLVGDDPLGSHVFVLRGAHDGTKGLHWLAITHAADAKDSYQPESRALQRLKAEATFTEKTSARMHPGMTAILTDAPLHPETRSGKDFVIMS
ncbi:MAG: L,D-transpeptidase [Bradyrhizobium sp.]|nr:L,D-transpeptidase [Bradyrhizobium sp.]